MSLSHDPTTLTYLCMHPVGQHFLPAYVTLVLTDRTQFVFNTLIVSHLLAPNSDHLYSLNYFQLLEVYLELAWHYTYTTQFLL